MASYTTTDAGITSTTATGHPGPGGSTNNTAGSGLKDGVQGVKGVLAGIHGVGEKVRGEFNGAVDGAFNENGSQSEGVVKNAAVANAGDAERKTGQFTHATKNREGAIPGDNERRF